LVAKTRQVSSPTFVRRFNSSHSPAQARIFSRLARGRLGGGFVVSTGASGGSLGALSTFAAGAGAGGFGAGVGGFCVAVAAAGAGFGGVGLFAVGFAGAGFVAFGFAGVAAGAGVCACADDSARHIAPARQPAASPVSDDAVLPAAAIVSLSLRKRSLARRFS
jgi:hypothetical protein